MLEVPAYEVDAGEIELLLLPLTTAGAAEQAAGLAGTAADARTAGTAAPAVDALFRSQGFGGAACINQPLAGLPELSRCSVVLQ